MSEWVPSESTKNWLAKLETDLAAEIRRQRWQDFRELAPIVGAVLLAIAGIGVLFWREQPEIVVLAVVVGLLAGLRR